MSGSRDIENLYDALRGAHPHPHDWMMVLRKPPILRRREIAGWKKNRLIFAEHGFWLTDTVADRYRLSDPQRFDEDAGGAIIRRLTEALAGQLIQAPAGLLNPSPTPKE